MQTEQWGVLEIGLEGPAEGNPFTDVRLRATFEHAEVRQSVAGFYDGSRRYVVRFQPDRTGGWTFTTQSNVAALNGRQGSFTCMAPSAGNHGPVKVRDQFHFAYADGTPYFPFGTTCYAWIHQPEARQEQTLLTLAASPFNKMRMCLFPKHYDYNLTEPELSPFEGSLDQGFDFDRFNPEFFRHLERRIADLGRLGVECDLILFHPYDRWGFSDLGARDEAYIDYVVARLSAFRHVWWSLANEFDLFLRPDGTPKKTDADWDRLGQRVAAQDPYGRLLSIHNCLRLYDHRQPWITHSSIQRMDHYKTSENTTEWRNQFGKPVVIDECTYEGNINHGWGNISGEELTRRFWEGTVRGGYVGHGETYIHPQDILWWAHGGELHGTSPARIAFLRSVVEAAPGPLSPVIRPEGSLFDPNWDGPCASADGYRLYYYGFCRPSFRVFSLPESPSYRVEVIDTWDMTITPVPGRFSGRFRIELPGKPFMAVRMAL